MKLEKVRRFAKRKVVWLVPIVMSCILLSNDLELKTLLTVVAALISFVYFVQKQSMEDDKLELEAFSNFNNRYFSLASQIALIHNKSEDEHLTDTEKQTLDQYFSLCVEEYFYFKKGRISLEIWQNWAHGISATVRSHALIQNYWNKTIRNKVNYGLTLKEVEKYLRS